MERLALLLLGLSMTFILTITCRALLVRLVIKDYETGLLYTNGRFRRTLGPGAYHLLRRRHVCRILDMRRSVLTVPGQEVLSADNVGLKVSLSIAYQVADPISAAHEVIDLREYLYTLAQLALRNFVADSEVDKLLARRGDAGTKLRDIVTPEAGKLGLRVHWIEIKDVMFPGELKNLFAAAVRARNEGQASLEKARAETAAMRNLANAAGLMENHPSLLSLRWIQALDGRSDKPGNTVIVSMPGGILPIKETNR